MSSINSQWFVGVYPLKLPLHIFQVLETSGFLPEDNLIEIMNPMEEGLYAWFTVNFLLGKFDKIEQVRYYLCPYGN